MTLATDICRCHDAGCRDHARCQRWTERHFGTVCAQSCFPYDIPIDDPCPLRIPTDATGNLARPPGPVDSQASQ